MTYRRNEMLQNAMLPVDIVLAPAWWHRHEGITFDADFFYHPRRRVEVERRMEQALYERWGRFGLGADHDRDLPAVGAVHLAAGYFVSEMLGCRVEYLADAPPRVLPANLDAPQIAPEAAFESPAFKRFEKLVDALKTAARRPVRRRELQRRAERGPRSPRPGVLDGHARSSRRRPRDSPPTSPR